MRTPPEASVVVADDNHDAADSMAMLLEAGGFAVSVAYGGSEALARILHERPSAAILDIGMVDMTGYEVARAVRDAGYATYLLALTGWGQATDIARAKEAGFDEHLTKPVDPDRVEALLRQRIDRNCQSDR